MQRLPPLPDDQWDDEVRSALAGMLPRSRQNRHDAGNTLATLVHHPDLTKAFLALSLHLNFRSPLPARLRELAILRVAKLKGCEYEWVHHVQLAAQTGLSAAEIQSAGRGEAANPLDAAVLRAVDELDADATVSDRTWAELGADLDKRQRMDLIFAIGSYTMLALALNTFGVEPENER